MTPAKARRLVAHGGRLEGLGALRSDTDQPRVRARRPVLYLPRCEMGRAGASQGSVAGSAGRLAEISPPPLALCRQRSRTNEALCCCFPPVLVSRSPQVGPRCSQGHHCPVRVRERSSDPAGELGVAVVVVAERNGVCPMGPAPRVLRLRRRFGLLT